jgi:hypothetical protein
MAEDVAGGERRTLAERCEILDSSLVARLIEIITEGLPRGSTCALNRPSSGCSRRKRDLRYSKPVNRE